MKQTIILSCPTLKRELQTAIGSHAAEAAVYFLPRHLHNDPKELSRYLQDMIDSFYNVRRIVVCASRCGGGTANLRATSAELVLPRTRDCLDILLSEDSLDKIQRNIRGIYFTASWMEFSKESEIDLGKLTAKMGLLFPPFRVAVFSFGECIFPYFGGIIKAMREDKSCIQFLI